MKNKNPALTAIACAIAIFAFLPALSGASHLEEAMALPELDQLPSSRSGGDFRQGRGPQTALASLTLPIIQGSVDEPGRNRALASGFAGGGLSETSNIPPVPKPSTGLDTVESPGGDPNAPPPSLSEQTTAELQAGIANAPASIAAFDAIGLPDIGAGIVNFATNKQKGELAKRASGGLGQPTSASQGPQAFGLDQTGNADFSNLDGSGGDGGGGSGKGQSPSDAPGTPF